MSKQTKRSKTSNAPRPAARTVDTSAWESLPIDEQKDAMIKELTSKHGGLLSSKDMKAMVNSLGFSQQGKGCKLLCDEIIGNLLYTMVAQASIRVHAGKRKRCDADSAKWALEKTHGVQNGTY